MSKGENPPFHVLIPAAGSGTRCGPGVPKQYFKIGGKTILRHTIEKFLGMGGLQTLHVVISQEHQDLYEESVVGLGLPPPLIGGSTRKQSVRNALQSLCHPERSEVSQSDEQKRSFAIAQDDIMLIHDAARPFVAMDTVTALLAAMKGAQAATLACSVFDTLVTKNYKAVDRNEVSAVQTPQAFRLSILRDAHEKFADDERFTDDAGIVAAMGVDVALVPGSRLNFKITTDEDMERARIMLTAQREVRTGFGYDVHAFDPAPATTIRLGGIDIPHDRKLAGHSDADVILHALTDALLGTVGDGDIGQIFPPSDPQWKGADSAIFITEALRHVTAKGGIVTNADVTLIAEAPKIGPHRDKIQNRLSSLLGVAKDRIGLKATTSEGLGFIGRREGIAAQVIVTVTFDC